MPQPCPSRSLLLLPPPPAPSTYENIKAAYHASLFQVLRELARDPERVREAALLDIALPCPHLYGHLSAPRGSLYATTQSLVANLYKLVCVIAAKGSIDTEDAEAVDARVVLVAYPRDGKLVQPPEEASTEQDAQGPAIHLHTLARSPRPWGNIFSVQSEEGEEVLKNFLSLSPARPPPSKVRGGIVSVHPPAAPPSENAYASTSHLSVAVGGTFDHLHIGHKLLLTMFAFVLGRRSPPANHGAPSTLTIGITGDELLKNKKHADVLESWGHRQKSTHDFLSSLMHFGEPQDTRIVVEERSEGGPNGHAVHVTYPSNLVIKYVEIADPFGPTVTDESISALVVSKETRGGGQAVNAKRDEKGWGPLEVFEVDVLDAGEEGSAVDETFQSKLSSTEIRRILSERRRPAQAG